MSLKTRKIKLMKRMMILEIGLRPKMAEFNNCKSKKVKPIISTSFKNLIM